MYGHTVTFLQSTVSLTLGLWKQHANQRFKHSWSEIRWNKQVTVSLCSACFVWYKHITLSAFLLQRALTALTAVQYILKSLSLPSLCAAKVFHSYQHSFIWFLLGLFYHTALSSELMLAIVSDSCVRLASAANLKVEDTRLACVWISLHTPTLKTDIQSLMPAFLVGVIKVAIVKYSHTEQAPEINC